MPASGVGPCQMILLHLWYGSILRVFHDRIQGCLQCVPRREAFSPVQALTRSRLYRGAYRKVITSSAALTIARPSVENILHPFQWGDATGRSRADTPSDAFDAIVMEMHCVLIGQILGPVKNSITANHDMAMTVLFPSSLPSVLTCSKLFVSNVISSRILVLAFSVLIPNHCCGSNFGRLVKTISNEKLMKVVLFPLHYSLYMLGKRSF